jgi:hypothetical protein
MAKNDDTQSTVDHIWNSAPIIPGLDPTLWRLSPCGLPIAYYNFNVTGPGPAMRAPASENIIACPNERRTRKAV